MDKKKYFGMIILFTLFSCAFVSAANISNGKKCPVIVCEFGKNFEFRYPVVSEPKIETITGIIQVTNKGFVKIECDDGESYVLTNDKKFVSKDGDSVSWSYIKNQKGKLMTVSGVLNDETGVFTVIKIGKVSGLRCIR